jgi:hypothetical protein
MGSNRVAFCYAKEAIRDAALAERKATIINSQPLRGGGNAQREKEVGVGGIDRRWRMAIVVSQCFAMPLCAR